MFFFLDILNRNQAFELEQFILNYIFLMSFQINYWLFFLHF